MTNHGRLPKVELILAVLMITTFATVLNAEIITFAFSGTVTEVEDPCEILDPSIIVGSAFNGSYTFNSDAIDRNPDPRWGRYGGSQAVPDVFSMSVVVGNKVFEPIRSASISVDDEVTYDSYGVHVGIDPEAFDYAAVELFLGGEADFLDSDSLPITPPLLEETFSSVLGISYMSVLNPFSNVLVGGTLSSLTLVPEPTTILVLALGGLLLRKRRV